MPIKYLARYMNFAFFVFIISATGNAFAGVNPGQNPVNFSEIYNYAHFSSAVYRTIPNIDKVNSLQDFTITHYGNIPGFEITYILATNEASKKQVIAVRGTSNVENAFIDIALKLVQDNHTGIRLHNGFSQAASAIYTEIKPILKNDYVINTTGHSLGGAVAVILAMYMDMDNYKIGKVVTFGQPKLTNISGANKFKHLNLIRVVTQKDIIPLIPPLDPVDLNDLDIYWHPGTEVILLPENTYAITEGIESMLRAIKFTQEPLSEKNLENHQMSLYMTMLKTKLTSSRLVPFKSSLNLFNWFDSE